MQLRPVLGPQIAWESIAAALGAGLWLRLRPWRRGRLVFGPALEAQRAPCSGRMLNGRLRRHQSR
eukprot:7383967-Prymnesium_polylepis.1